MKMDSSNLRSWDGHLANTEKLSTLTLLTYPHAEAAATYPLLFFQQLLQKA